MDAWCRIKMNNEKILSCSSKNKLLEVLSKSDSEGNGQTTFRVRTWRAWCCKMTPPLGMHLEHELLVHYKCSKFKPHILNLICRDLYNFPRSAGSSLMTSNKTYCTLVDLLLCQFPAQILSELLNSLFYLLSYYYSIRSTSVVLSKCGSNCNIRVHCTTFERCNGCMFSA